MVDFSFFFIVGFPFILLGCPTLFYVPVMKLTKQIGNLGPKSNKKKTCLGFHLIFIALRHMQLFERFLEGKLKHLDAS